MSSELALFIAAVLLFGNAFFVAAEFALVSARRSSLEPRALEGSRRAKVTLKAMENVSVMMAGAQLGITLCSLGLGALGEPAIAHYIEGPLTSLGVSHDLLHPISFVIALTVMTFLHVVLGEMVPKNITLAGPDRSALLLAPALRTVVRILKPAVVSLNAIANASLRFIGIQPRDEVASAFTRDEVAGFVEESHREGLLSEEKEHLVTGTLHFDSRLAKRILVPLNALVTIAPDAQAGDVEKIVSKTGFSRLPVMEKTGEIKGYVHIKDILQLEDASQKMPIPKKIIRPLARVKENDTLRTVLAKMQKAGTHMAVVMGSKNNPLGVAMLEDALEELVGEIRDESQKIR